MKFIFLLLLSSSAFAKGSGGAADLIPSIFNVSLLIAMLIYFLKEPLRAHFAERSKSTKEMIEMAANKAAEAKAAMEIEQEKMTKVDAKISSMQSDIDSQLAQFETDYKTSLTSRVANLKSEANQKIESERKDLLDNLSSTLLDQVIAKSRDILKSDSSLNKDAANKMIEGLK